MQQNISLNDFKINCSKLTQQVATEQLELILTKHGKPLVRVTSLPFSHSGRLNTLKGTAIMADDLIDPIQIHWDCTNSVDENLI